MSCNTADESVDTTAKSEHQPTWRGQRACWTHCSKIVAFAMLGNVASQSNYWAYGATWLETILFHCFDDVELESAAVKTNNE